MRINADFSMPALVIPRAEDWVKSPESGVDRLMLDRIGDEVARATSIVRYAAGSSFSKHVHARGEEFLVLDGVFSDESGDFPQGTYVRNPPGSSHAPGSKDGCRILVKLRQFDDDDLERVVVDTTSESGWQSVDDSVHVLPLHSFGSERVEMRRIDSGATMQLVSPAGGAEMLVVDGELEYEDELLCRECWLRLPEGQDAGLRAVSQATIWLKTGHLPAAS